MRRRFPRRKHAQRRPPSRRASRARRSPRGSVAVDNLPPLDDPAMEPLRSLLEDPEVKKTMQNAKRDMLTLRTAGVALRGVDFDTMVASYVLDPGRRTHELELLSLEFLNRKLTGLDELCGKGKDAIPFDEVPVECARDYSAENADVVWQLRALFEPQLEQLQLAELFNERRDAARRSARGDGVARHHDRHDLVRVAQGAVRA